MNTALNMNNTKVKREFDDLIDSLNNAIKDNNIKFVNNTLKEFLLASLNDKNSPVTSLIDIYHTTLQEFPGVSLAYKWQCESNVLASLNQIILPAQEFISATTPWLSEVINNKLTDFMSDLILKLTKNSKKTGGGPFNRAITRVGQGFMSAMPALSVVPSRALNLPRYTPSMKPVGFSTANFSSPYTYTPNFRNTTYKKNNKPLSVFFKNRNTRRLTNMLNGFKFKMENAPLPFNNNYNIEFVANIDDLPNADNIAKFSMFIKVLSKDYITGKLKEVASEYGKKINKLLEDAVKSNIKVIIKKYERAIGNASKYIVKKYYMKFCDGIIRKLVSNIIHTLFSNIQKNHEWTAPVINIIENQLLKPLSQPTNFNNTSELK
jgi:hypothetical protein